MAKRKCNSVENFKSKKLKLDKSLPSTKLIDLHKDVLDIILGKINLRDRISIRGTCKHLQNVTDDLLWYEFQVALHQYSQDSVKHHKYGPLQVNVTY
jgi:hypothetical protein